MVQSEPLPYPKQFPRRYKRLIIVSFVIILAVVILVAPIIPIQHVVTKTRTRNLRYSSAIYGIYLIAKIINVTNTDKIGGTFTVTMKEWSNSIVNLKQVQELEDTHAESAYIKAGETRTFNLPDDWLIMEPMSSLTYSVSPPSTQQAYNVTETEYKSILNLIESSLRA
jgi:hypothetical protein